MKRDFRKALQAFEEAKLEIIMVEDELSQTPDNMGDWGIAVNDQRRIITDEKWIKKFCIHCRLSSVNVGQTASRCSRMNKNCPWQFTPVGPLDSPVPMGSGGALNISVLNSSSYDQYY